MKRSAILAMVLVSGAFLTSHAVSADPGWRNDRDGRYDRYDRNDRHDRNDRDHDRYDNRQYDRRDYSRSRTTFDIRIGYGVNIYRHPYYVRPSAYWMWDHGYRPHYYRGRTLVVYPDRSWEREPAEKIIWMDSSNNPVTEVSQNQVEEERYCREYTADADVNGRAQQVYGTACMQPDGTWQIVE